jgi:hypothetical protein
LQRLAKEHSPTTKSELMAGAPPGCEAPPPPPAAAPDMSLSGGTQKSCATMAMVSEISTSMSTMWRPAAAKKARAKAVSAYERKRIDLERHYLNLDLKYSLDQAVEMYRAGAWPPGRTQVRANGLPYPGAQVLYPQRGIIQGGTGPFYGPTGTLFDRTPDMLWDYPGVAVRNNGKKTRRNGVEVAA